MPDEKGQASVELVAGLPALLLAGLVALQLLAAGYALTLADGAAEAGAAAIAAGRSPGRAVTAALPGWAEEGVRFEARGGRVEVHLRPPSVIPGLGAAMGIESSAAVEVRR